MSNTIKIGVMPGRINEFAVEEGTTVEQALQLAELTVEGYDIKLDGASVDATALVDGKNVLLLTKKVKGNATVKIGVMPGRIQEYALSDETTFADALALAELSTEGYEIKADGNTVTDLDNTIGNTNVILLTKKVKGN